ncbi:MAG: hypothetical protein AB1918_07785 [Pseudomonadota bacterium]
MDRINSANKAVDLFGAGKHGFKAGVPATGERATYMTPDWCNAVQEAPARAIERFLGPLDPADHEQLADAIEAAIAAALAGYVGFLRPDVAATLSAGYFTAPVPVAIAAGHAALDLDAGNVITIAVDGAFTLDFPAGLAGKAGMVLVVATQDGVGGHALTLAAGYRLASGAWDTTAGAVNLLWVTSDGGGAALDVVIAQRGA